MSFACERKRKLAGRNERESGDNEDPKELQVPCYGMTSVFHKEACDEARKRSSRQVLPATVIGSGFRGERLLHQSNDSHSRSSFVSVIDESIAAAAKVKKTADVL